MLKELHPLCEVFPEMSEEEFGLLCNSVKQNGLRNPIVLHKDGRILDGRGRQSACEKMGVEPKYKTFRGNDEAAAQFVIDENIARRHLKQGQLAAFAANALGWYQKQADARKAEGQKKGGEKGGRPKKGENLDGKNSVKVPRAKPAEEAVARAAKDFRTNPKYVAAAAKIKRKDPALFRRVERGAIKIPQALRVLEKREEEEEKQRHQEEDPNWVDWEKEVKGYKKRINKFSKRIRALENECVDICTSFPDVREHMDSEDVVEILNGCFSDTHAMMGRGVALFEQFMKEVKKSC